MARSPSPALNSLLVGSLTLILGAFGGYLLGQSSPPAVAKEALPTARVADLGATAARASEHGAAIRAPGLEALDHNPGSQAAAPQVSARSAVGAALPGASPQAAAAETSPAVRSLLEELDALLASGSLQAHFAGAADERQLAGFLLEQYLRIGQPELGIALLGRTAALGHEAWAQVAGAFQAAGQKVRAADALAEALRRSQSPDTSAPLNFEWPMAGYLQQLGALEPSMALALIEPRLAQASQVAPEMRLCVAELLEQAGRTAEARSAALGLLEGETLYQGLSLLARVDPEHAEQELRTRLAQGDDEALGVQLLQLLATGNRPQEALELLDQRIAAGQSADEMLIAAIKGLPEALTASRLEAWIAGAQNPPNVLQQLGEVALSSGDLELASNRYLRSWDNPEQNGWLPFLPDEVIQHDPARVRAALESASSHAGQNDEVWGDIADHFWRLGDKQRAFQAWSNAHDLDPSDSEWSGKISQYNAGGDPLGGGSGSGMLHFSNMFQSGTIETIVGPQVLQSSHF